jgi:hypothetical protein
MLNSGSELITISAGINYEPTFISTDKRAPAGVPTSLGYWQIGELAQYGFAKGPIFRVEFADLTAVGSSYVKIWALENQDSNAPVYPISYLTTNRPIMDIYFKKFIFCDALGEEVAEGGSYTIIGYKKKTMLTVW